jgi:hypothetical protein
MLQSAHLLTKHAAMEWFSISPAGVAVRDSLKPIGQDFTQSFDAIEFSTMAIRQTVG